MANLFIVGYLKLNLIIMLGAGLQSISVKATLTNSDRELIKQPTSINKNNSIYKNTKISFKSKDLGDDADIF